MATAIPIQRSDVPMVTITLPNGQRVSGYITQEHRRPLDELVKTVNDLLARVEALEA